MSCASCFVGHRRYFADMACVCVCLCVGMCVVCVLVVCVCGYTSVSPGLDHMSRIERPLRLPKSVARQLRVAIWNDNETYGDKRKHPGPQNIVSCLQHTCWNPCRCGGVSCSPQRSGSDVCQYTRSCFINGTRIEEFSLTLSLSILALSPSILSLDASSFPLSRSPLSLSKSVLRLSLLTLPLDPLSLSLWWSLSTSVALDSPSLSLDFFHGILLPLDAH